MGKKYTLELTVDEAGKETLHRINSGFNLIELVGLMPHTLRDLELQADGMIKPDIVKRSVVKD